MKRYLFFSIGNRDLQFTYEDSSRKYRKPPRLDKVDFEELKTVPAHESESYREPKAGDRPEEKNSSGITFPIFCKTLAYLKENNVKKLDAVFIIATDRSGVLPKLQEIKKAWEENLELVYKDPGWMDLYDYLVEGILFHAEKDRTGKLARFLKSRIEAGSLPLYDVEIQSVHVLNLGPHGSFKPILKHNPPEKKAGIEVLGKADINTLGFFEHELYQALKPYFGDLEDSNVYLGTHSGGMPLMNRALDNVLQGAVNYARYERIFTSEYLSYQLDRSLQSRFLNWLKKMNDNVMVLNWDTAQYYCKKIINSEQGHADKERFEGLDKIIQRAMDFTAAKAGWFERFSAQIFRSLYTVNMNETVVWMKSMQESSLHHLFRQQCGKLWQSFRDGRIILHPGANGKKGEDVGLNLRTLASKVGENEFRKAFKDYIELFVNPVSLEDLLEWQNLTTLRNKLLHEGKSVTPRDMQPILEFLDIGIETLRDAIAHLQENNLKKVREFESKCLGNKYFSSLARIAGFQKNVLEERNWSQRFFDDLHKSG